MQPEHRLEHRLQQFLRGTDRLCRVVPQAAPDPSCVFVDVLEPEPLGGHLELVKNGFVLTGIEGLVQTRLVAAKPRREVEVLLNDVQVVEGPSSGKVGKKWVCLLPEHDRYGVDHARVVVVVAPSETPQQPPVALDVVERVGPQSKLHPLAAIEGRLDRLDHGLHDDPGSRIRSHASSFVASPGCIRCKSTSVGLTGGVTCTGWDEFPGRRPHGALSVGGAGVHEAEQRLL